MTVVTRFAPSPTGYLHIGGARTALFNWLFARHHGGKFLLRIEDTDRARSTPDAVEKIFEGLRWLGLEWDEEPVFQFSRAARHAEVAHQLIAKGEAYKCTCTPDELTAMREKAKVEGRPIGYDGRCRRSGHDPAKPFVVRLKSPESGETVIDDKVQGVVRFPNAQLDDMILLRSDGTPTYMLSVVVDDHDMGITNIIRGDDHLTNAGRQALLYQAMGWEAPVFAHIPLIHGPDGAKLSKRHGALGAEAYRDMGFLPEAMRNYLLRLGWGHGDDEIISTEQAIAWFDLDAVGKSPSRFDMDKLSALNGHYLRSADDARLADLIAPTMEARLGHPLPAPARTRIAAGMEGLKPRAKNLVELAESALFYAQERPLRFDEKALKNLDSEAIAHIAAIVPRFENETAWTRSALEDVTRIFSETHEIKLGKIAQPLRAALTGAATSPPVFEIMEILGREESLARLKDVLHLENPTANNT
ncbi:MAG: glutamate--tRNA ligase [Alphaproteobacteria bacterium RIFOXYD12_FULL_60_8]|nr:MAG: glutamate--tRNA ligase [Alphaproteobacteria bacterium RIFOXYD12_FULL_60_8]